jgi:hypothetical protein
VPVITVILGKKLIIIVIDRLKQGFEQ